MASLTPGLALNFLPAPQVEDLDAFARIVAAKQPTGTPVFLGGQSMGGLVALHSALSGAVPWHGLILTSALVDVEWTTTLK